MSSERIFVGRDNELNQFDKLLASPKGRAVVVVGQTGMRIRLSFDKPVARVHDPA